MASIFDAFNDACTDNLARLKILLYSLPVFGTVYFYMRNDINTAYIFAGISAVLIIGLLTCGIYNVASSKKEILTFDAPFFIITLLKLCITILPIGLVFGYAGYLITNTVKIPDVYHMNIIFDYVIWILMLSIVITSFLTFARSLKITAAYNFKIIFDSVVDVVVSILYMLVQLAVIDGILGGFAFYIQKLFHFEMNNPVFLYFYSILVILNVSMIADYLAQVSYESIKNPDKDKEIKSI